MRKKEHKTSDGQDVTFKECTEAFKTRGASICPNKVEKAIAKLIKRVTPEE